MGTILGWLICGLALMIILFAALPLASHALGRAAADAGDQELGDER